MVIMFTWICWLLVSNLATATKPWQYGLVIFSALLWLALVYLLLVFFRLERKLWGMLRDTVLTLDPHTKSISVDRAGDVIELTTANTALIEHHWLNQGKFGHYFYRFVDHSGRSTAFYDYGKGLPVALDVYFKGTPYRLVEHRYPFKDIPFS
ncbi:hypothetical protein [Fibrella aquatilis]|uniref:Uncharacterized protein n=1 Tax=Fibrella aquatilis TaxID=2817059 RepID=A0A939K165_9BACT|nr:hypothetical protein [Fibrella aquatilis]MBO0932726.1 hypothetical protein [Fibrella aquatilis]